MKKSVSKLGVINNKNKNEYIDTINMLNCHFINSKNILEECIKRNKRKVNFEYDINYKKELELKRN